MTGVQTCALPILYNPPMSHPPAFPRPWRILLFLLLTGILLSLGLGAAHAVPFQSPLAANQIHVPLITRDNSPPASPPITATSQGVPLPWLLGLFLLLIVLAVALTRTRQR